MKKRIVSVVSVLLILALTVTFFACKTSANWATQKNESKNSNANLQETNGSAKYIVFAALDDEGELIPAGSSSAIEAYAVVGYTGDVSELVVPDEFAGAVVTKILAVTPYSAYQCFMNGVAYTGEDARLQNNPLITSIRFGSNVTYVGAAVCAGMTSLASVYFDHVEAGVTLGANAFAACPLLTSGSITYKPAPESPEEP